MANEARNRPLPDWFTRIRTHQLVLPRFQRFEAWSPTKVTQLFNTLLQDLPIGAALILEIGNDEPFISRPLKGAPIEGERVTEHLLDGQQRLTALWRGLHNNYDERTYFLVLESDPDTGLPYYVESIGRWQREQDKESRPFWANYPAEQWKRHLIPLNLCSPDIGAQQAFREWVRKAIESQDDRDRISDQIALVRQKFASFNLPFLSLLVTTQKSVALDVFIKTNTGGEPLSIFDIIVAQIEAAEEKSLHDLISSLKATCPLISEYYSPDDLVLYASALLQGRPPTNATYLVRDFGSQLLAGWDLLVEGIQRAGAFLEEERILDAARLPTDVVVPVLAALWAHAPKALDTAGKARNLLRRYLWRAFFTDRYESATSTTALADFNELEGLITGTSTTSPSVFDDTLYPLPEPQELIASRWPKRKDRLARAVLALALKQGGVDLADGSTVSRANLARREYHHLFPDAYLRDRGISDDQIYRSLNCALVTWQTNRNISSKEPERYLAERREGTDLGEAEIRARLATHLVPYDEMVAGDYNAFLVKRASLVHAAMLQLCATGGTQIGLG
jgi:hypothetical protein